MPEASQALKRSAPPALQPRGCEERDEVAEKYAALLAQYDQVLRAHAELEGRYQQLLLQGNDPVQRKAELKGRAGVLAEERETGRADGRKSGVEDVMGALEREVERLEGARAQLEATREGAQRREEARAAEVAYWRREATAAEVARAAKGGELEALKQMLVDEMRGPRGGAERREPAAAPRALPPPPAEEHQVPRPPRAAGIGVVLERVDGETDVFVKSIAPGGAAERDGRVQAGDEVHAVDGVSVRGLPLEDVLRLVLGPEGSQLRLRLRRPAPRPASKILTPRRGQTAPNRARRAEAKGKAEEGAAGAGGAAMWVELSLTRRAVAMSPSLGTLELSPPRQRTPRPRILTPRQHRSAPAGSPSQAHYTSLPRSLAASPTAAPALRGAPQSSPPGGPTRSSATPSPALRSSASVSPDLPFFALPVSGWQPPWLAQAPPLTAGGSLRSYPRAPVQAPIRRASQF